MVIVILFYYRFLLRSETEPHLSNPRCYLPIGSVNQSAKFKCRRPSSYTFLSKRNSFSAPSLRSIGYSTLLMQKKKTSSLHHRINHKPKHLFSKKKTAKKLILSLLFHSSNMK